MYFVTYIYLSHQIAAKTKTRKVLRILMMNRVTVNVIIWSSTSSLIIFTGRRTPERFVQVSSLAHWSSGSTKRYIRTYFICIRSEEMAGPLMSLADALRRNLFHFLRSPSFPLAEFSPFFPTCRETDLNASYVFANNPAPLSLQRKPRQRALAARLSSPLRIKSRVSELEANYCRQIVTMQLRNAFNYAMRKKFAREYIYIFIIY